MGSAISTINYSADVQAMFAYTSDPNYTKQLVLSVAESDFYEVTVQEGNKLIIETSTPSGGPGEFVNNLAAIVRVYDGDGNVVDTYLDEATGELNTAPLVAGGTYYIEVTGSGTVGEYVLSVKQTTSTVLNPLADGEADGAGARLASVSDAAYPWLNRAKPVDVSNDGYVTPKDALLIINSLNAGGARSLSAAPSGDTAQPFYDVNGDGYLSPIDALQVINYLTTRTDGEKAPETLPSGDPAVTVQTTATPGAVARPRESLRRVERPMGIVTKLMAEPPAGSRFARIAETTDDVPGYVDVWENPDQDWVIESLGPEIDILAEDLAGKWEANNKNL